MLVKPFSMTFSLYSNQSGTAKEIHPRTKLIIRRATPTAKSILAVIVCPYIFHLSSILIRCIRSLKFNLSAHHCLTNFESYVSRSSYCCSLTEQGETNTRVFFIFLFLLFFVVLSSLYKYLSIKIFK